MSGKISALYQVLPISVLTFGIMTNSSIEEVYCIASVYVFIYFLKAIPSGSLMIMTDSNLHKSLLLVCIVYDQALEMLHHQSLTSYLI